MMADETDGRMALSIILPTYNECENIVALVSDLLDKFAPTGKRFEILVVDDSSPDGTARLVSDSFAGNQNIRCLVRTADRGLANSIRHGIEASTGEVVVVMDTDFNHRPEDAKTLFHFAEHVDLALGSRFIFGGGMPNRLRYYLSYLYNIFMRLTLGTRLDDNLSGFFAIRRTALQKLDFDKIFWGYGDYFFRLLLLSQRENFRHVELPVMYGDRMGGIQKTRFIQVFIKYTGEVLRIVYLRIAGKW